MEESSNNKQNFISASQFASIIFGAIVGVGILSIPNGAVKTAHQDAWISTLIGGLYPLYVVLIARYISKKFPDQNILVLSKKYFGRFLGSVMNFIFATYFLFAATIVASYYSNLMRTHIMGFLTSFKMIAVLFIFIVYAVSRGLKVLGIISEISLYITVALVLAPMVALRESNITNIYPVFGSGIGSITVGGMQTAFSYSGSEIILLIYPYLKEKKKMLASSLIAVALAVVLYVWCVFITIYYLGPDIVRKSYWSFLLVTGSVTVTVVNNFRYIFMIFWSLVAFKSISIYSYSTIVILKDFLYKIKVKKIYFLMYPVFVCIALKYGNEINRGSISDNVIKYYVIFNLAYMTVIAVFVLFKGGPKLE